MPESETDSSSGGMPNIYAIADHIRAAAFAVSDGIAPSNEERGYVIRNILRKAALHGKNLGIDKPFLYKLIFPVSKAMEGPYPELAKRHSDISQVVLAEEERFASTLKNGIPLLKGLIADAKKQGRKILSAEDVFKLSDTYGIPFDVTTEICIEEGFAAPSKEDFEKLLQAQRQQSRKASKMQGAVFVDTGIREATEFVGYEETEAKARAIRMFSSENREIERADKNNGRIFIILDKSVYYGESGGQRGDSGKLCMQGLQVRIYDAKKSRDAILLEGEVLEGELKKGDVVNTVIDKERRLNIARNHTATHILQYALRKVLGEHVKQQGSYVGDGEEGLRFDFCHFKALSKEELARVEEIVNEKIRDNNTVDIAYLEIEEAKKQGALAFFDDKYGQKVRMVSVGDYSKELCGGTHLKTTGQIGNFKIVSESSIASGIRRIEAKTAKAADKIISQEQELISALADLLSCKPNQLLARCEKLLSDFDTLNKRIDGLISKRIAASADDIIKNSQQVADTKLIITKLTDADMEILKKTADIIKGRLKSFVLFLVSVKDEKISLLLSVSDDLVKKGIDAGKLMAELSRLIGGSGGGRPNMALGGAKDVNKLDYLLKEAGVFLRGEIK
jgi:alanyl-tRNA synthetase